MSKELELLNLLIVRTSKGLTTWEPTAKEHEFVTVIADEISVLIAEVGPRAFAEEGPDYILTVKDKHDLEIFSIRNSLDDVRYKDLAALYELARRSALNIEKTLDILLKNLRKEES